MKKFGLIAIIVGVVGLMVAIFLIGNKGPAAPAADGARIGQQFPNLGQTHLKEGDPKPTFNSNPPTSGSHNPAPTTWGVHDEQVADETLVHNLEHGGIVIQYKPDLPADQIAQLKQIVASLPPSKNFNSVKAVLVPRTANERPISLTGWTYLEHLDSVDAAKIQEFYLSHVDKGPELVP